MTEAFLLKRLSFLIRAGMPLTQSLALLATQTRNTRRTHAIEEAGAQVAAGQSLAASLEKGKLVGSFSASIISIGEASGTLPENLEYLAHELEKRAALRSKILGALIYPALIAAATIALTAGLILFIFPKILPVFEGLQVELPFSTRAVLWVHGLLRRSGMVMLLGLAVTASAGTFLLRHSAQARLYLEHIVHYVPLVRPLREAYLLATLTRTLALLLDSGMPLTAALSATSRVMPSEWYRRELTLLADEIAAGAAVASRLQTKRTLFPDLVAQMIHVGESSGSLSESLRYLATYYSASVEEQTKRLTSLAEPALMIVMGGVVGFVAVSMITPMYEITQHLSTH